jgi:Cu+-exporting ATPase
MPPTSLSSQATKPDGFVELDIAGMTCAACVRRFDKALRSVDGVQQAQVNLVTQRATVRFETARAELADLSAAV